MSRINEIRERVEEATKGPWSTRALNAILRHARKSSGYWDDVQDDYPDDPGTYPDDGDTSFIAHAREDIPWLLEEIKRLEGCIADYDDMQGRLDDTNGFVSDLIGLILDHCGKDGGHPDDQYTVSDMESLLMEKREQNAKLREMLSAIHSLELVEDVWTEEHGNIREVMSALLGMK